MDLSSTTVRNAIRGNQIICGVLLFGQVLLGIAIAIAHRMGIELTVDMSEDVLGMLSWLGIGVGVASIPMAHILRLAIWKKGASGGDQAMLQGFFTGNIAFHAVLEGASLLNLTLWLVTTATLPFVAVAGVIVVFGTVAFLTKSKPQL